VKSHAANDQVDCCGTTTAKRRDLFVDSSQYPRSGAGSPRVGSRPRTAEEPKGETAASPRQLLETGDGSIDIGRKRQATGR